jgi:hypothetical protein
MRVRSPRLASGSIESLGTERCRPLLERLRRDLGLSDGVRLTATLHNVLVHALGG